jgi:hypothetical protein
MRKEDKGMGIFFIYWNKCTWKNSQSYLAVSYHFCIKLPEWSHISISYTQLLGLLHHRLNAGFWHDYENPDPVWRMGEPSVNSIMDAGGLLNRSLWLSPMSGMQCEVVYCHIEGQSSSSGIFCTLSFPPPHSPLWLSTVTYVNGFFFLTNYSMCVPQHHRRHCP